MFIQFSKASNQGMSPSTSLMDIVASSKIRQRTWPKKSAVSIKYGPDRALSVRKSWIMERSMGKFSQSNVGAIRFIIVSVVENRLIPDFRDGLERTKHSV